MTRSSPGSSSIIVIVASSNIGISPPPPPDLFCHTETSTVPATRAPCVYVADTVPSILSTPRNTDAERRASATSNVGRTYFSSAKRAEAASTDADAGALVSANDASTAQSPRVGSKDVGSDALATPCASATAVTRIATNPFGSRNVNVVAPAAGRKESASSASARARTVWPGRYCGLSVSRMSARFAVALAEDAAEGDDALAELANTRTSCLASGVDVSAADARNRRNSKSSFVASTDEGTSKTSVCASPSAAAATAEATVTGDDDADASTSATRRPSAEAAPCTRTRTEAEPEISAGATTSGADAAAKGAATHRRLAASRSAALARPRAMPRGEGSRGIVRGGACSGREPAAVTDEPAPRARRAVDRTTPRSCRKTLVSNVRSRNHHHNDRSRPHP